MSGYSRLRVEEGPPQRDTLAALPFAEPVAPARPLTSVEAIRRELEQTRKDAIYWQAECKRVIREREQLKAALEGDDAAAYFRAEWRKANTAVSAERAKRERLQGELDQAREACAIFTESRDRLQRTIEGVKRRLWEVWAELAEEHPLRRPLWSLWSTL
jgi:chromosome segregation ATPase